LADFLLGVPTTSAIRYGNADKYFRNSAFDVFVNDDWRVHPRFTLNVGVRWDYESHMMNYDYVTPKSVVDTLTRYNSQLPTPLDGNEASGKLYVEYDSSLSPAVLGRIRTAIRAGVPAKG